jgi:hypothetical protein
MLAIIGCIIYVFKKALVLIKQKSEEFFLRLLLLIIWI